MMHTLRFKQIDVFSSVPFKGNPVAVILDLEGKLKPEQMQQIANWTNLSETVFVVPKTVDEADYRVKIFTPQRELPFAGHPTIGTAHALLEAGILDSSKTTLVQQCPAGLIRINIEKIPKGDCGHQHWIALDLPQAIIKELTPPDVDELKALMNNNDLIRYPPMIVDFEGTSWVVAQCCNADAVLAIRPDLPRMAQFNAKTGSTGITIFGEYLGEDAPAKIEVRSFAPLHGISEDPVCGSGNGAVGIFIRHRGQSAHFLDKNGTYTASQGAVVGRAGQIRVKLNGENVQIAGTAVTLVDGQLNV